MSIIHYKEMHSVDGGRCHGAQIGLVYKGNEFVYDLRPATMISGIPNLYSTSMETTVFASVNGGNFLAYNVSNEGFVNVKGRACYRVYDSVSKTQYYVTGAKYNNIFFAENMHGTYASSSGGKIGINFNLSSVKCKIGGGERIYLRTQAQYVAGLGQEEWDRYESDEVRRIFKYVIDSSFMFASQDIKGEPVCGINTVDASEMYYSCRNITGLPDIGPKVVNASNIYAYCTNLKGPAVCPERVENAHGVYQGCSNIKGNGACGSNVTDFSYAYNRCSNLTGDLYCGDKVINMMSAYNSCSNATGTGTIGKSVEDARYAFYDCRKLGTAVIKSNALTTLSYAFYNCRNIINMQLDIEGTDGGSVFKLPSTLHDMTNAFCYCINLTSPVVMGSEVTNMYRVYTDCQKATGTALISPVAVNGAYAYLNCKSLTAISENIPDTLVDMDYMFQNCINVYGTVKLSANAKRYSYAFANCKSITAITAYPIGMTSFQHCLDNSGIRTTVAIPETVTNMSYAFYNCQNLTTKLAIPTAVTNMYYAFYNCKLISGIAEFPPNCTDASYAYTNTGITSVGTIPVTLTRLSGCFDYCKSLGGSIHFPDVPDGTSVTWSLRGRSSSSPLLTLTASAGTAWWSICNSYRYWSNEKVSENATHIVYNNILRNDNKAYNVNALNLEWQITTVAKGS